MIAGDSYKKRYWPLAAWAVLFLAVLIGLSLLAESRTDGLMMTKLLLAATVLALDLLLFLIRRLETVYWISGGPDFETAKAAGSERRRLYARRHLKRFLIVTVPLLVYLTFSALCRWPVWPDLGLTFAGLVGAAVSTLGIRFE